MSSIEDLQYFLAITKTLNISRAAELSGVSQPAMSQAIKRLEKELETPLLHREKTGVRLTRSGDRLSLKAREILDSWTTLAQSVRSSNQMVSGHFTIGCHPSVAIYSLPRFLKSLYAKYGDLQIGLTHGLSREIANDVIEWRVDFGIVINPPQHPDLVIKELGMDEVTLWCMPGSSPPDTLIYDPTLFQTQDIIKQLQKRKMTFTRKLETSNLELVSALTLAGVGVGILPTRVARNEGKSALKHYSENSPIFKDKLCLIYRVGTQSHASGRAIIEAIVKAGI